MKYIALLAAATIISGCTPGESEATKEKRGLPLAVEYRGRIMGEGLMPANTTITIVTLKDGTRCAVYLGRGGIDCDWRNSK